MELRKGRHCVFMLHAHIVFVTKYRGKIFDDVILERLEHIFSKICNEFETELKQFNGEHDHVHLLINYPPKIQLSKLVNSLKGVSSRLLKQEFPEIKNHWVCVKSGALWSPSYFIGSVGGAPLEILKQYIEQQKRPN